MAAHLRALPELKCATCGARATEELRNTFNAVVNWYCKRCAKRALAAFQREVSKGLSK